MNGKDFISLAGRLAVAGKSSEAEYRSAVSRAYYGAYHCARELLESFGFFGGSKVGNEHEWARRHFENCQVTEAATLGSLLKNLHTSRKEADYDLDKPGNNTQAAAKLAVERANKILSLLAQCQQNSTTIRTEMLAYRKLANVQ